MSTYLSFEVLDQTGHNMRESIAEAFERVGSLVVNPVGRKLWDEYAGVPLSRRSFEWFAHGRTEIAALRSFLDARKGRLTPFWTPTYCHELPMAADALAAQSSIKVHKVGYGQFLFAHAARKYLALVKSSGAFLMRKVTLVVDNGDGTETLTLDAGLGEDLPAATTRPSFLALCRLDEDTTLVRWYGPELAEATIAFREVPLEVPA